MSIPYLHTATIIRLGVNDPGDPRDDFGQPVTPDASTTIYSGAIDYQDLSFRERKTLFGDEMPMSAGWGFFPEGAFPSTVRTEDRMSVSGPAYTPADDVSVQGVIVDVDRVSGRVLMAVEAQPVGV